MLLLKQTKVVVTKAHNDVIYSCYLLFDVFHLNSLFPSQFSCQSAHQEEETNWSLSSGLQRKKMWNSWVTLVYFQIWFYYCLTEEQIFTICSHLFYYLLQQSEVGIPSSLLIHVRASGTLVTLKETGGTGSTLRTVETRWTFTATWQLTEVRSAPKKSEIVSNYSSFKLLFRFWSDYIPRLILYKQLPLSNLKAFNVNCTDIVWERVSRRRSSSFF